MGERRCKGTPSRLHRCLLHPLKKVMFLLLNIRLWFKKCSLPASSGEPTPLIYVLFRDAHTPERRIIFDISLKNSELLLFFSPYFALHTPPLPVRRIPYSLCTRRSEKYIYDHEDSRSRICRGRPGGKWKRRRWAPGRSMRQDPEKTGSYRTRWPIL